MTSDEYDPMNGHCLHWQDGDGDCCHCSEPNWCPDEGETPEALARFEQRRLDCPAEPRADAGRQAPEETP